MRTERASSWTALRPPLYSGPSRDALITHVRALIAARKEKEDPDEAIEEARRRFVEQTRACRRSDRQTLLASGLLVSDLAVQGWQLRVRSRQLEVCPPVPMSEDRAAEKARVRRQELVSRDLQLKQPSVQKFLRSMERSRLFGGRFVSIYSLMRDGREFAAALRRARQHRGNGWAEALSGATEPYLQFVSSNEVACALTGLRLMDIWRYFRHTWTNQYSSAPGRTMMFLVRDRAVPLHPVIGIGALASPVMQIRERDIWVGWHPEAFLAQLRASPTDALARWLTSVNDAAITETFVDDLLEDRIVTRRDLTHPNAAVIARLLAAGAEQRGFHQRFARSSDYKTKRPKEDVDAFWEKRARTHLFRSKRAMALASYLRARLVLKDAFGTNPTAKKLVALSSTGAGSDAIRKIVKKAKADKIGIAVADIAVCGAIQPYNAVLGGKLVAMLACSAEVILEYRRRYAGAESEIASSVAGRSIARTPNLVLLGTTSLYGVGSSQYNRIKIPCDRLGGSSDAEIHYRELGHSEAFGTSQYSDETVKALEDLVQQSDGKRVNSIFGEGASPRLRKVRQGLELLHLPTELLLRHHRPRVIYVVSLAQNLRNYLMGIDSEPRYITSLEDGQSGTAQIAAWWRERWLRNRIESEDVLSQLERHTLVHPIRHGARVKVQPAANQRVLFPEFYS